MHPTHIYMSHAPHLVEEPSVQHSVQQGRNIKIEHMPISWELHDKSMRFESILPKTSTYTIYKV